MEKSEVLEPIPVRVFQSEVFRRLKLGQQIEIGMDCEPPEGTPVQVHKGMLLRNDQPVLAVTGPPTGRWCEHVREFRVTLTKAEV